MSITLMKAKVYMLKNNWQEKMKHTFIGGESLYRKTCFGFFFTEIPLQEFYESFSVASGKW